MSEVIWEKSNNEGTSENEPRNKLHVGSQAKVKRIRKLKNIENL